MGMARKPGFFCCLTFFVFESGTTGSIIGRTKRQDGFGVIFPFPPPSVHHERRGAAAGRRLRGG